MTIDSHTKNQVNILNQWNKVVTTKYLAKFQSPTAVTVSWPKIIQPERISKWICNLWLYTLIPKIKSISQIIVKQGQHKAWRIPTPTNLTWWPWKSIVFQILLRTKYVPCLVKIHWRMLILECSQGCYAVKIWPSDIDLWPMTLKIHRVPDSSKD